MEYNVRVASRYFKGPELLLDYQVNVTVYRVWNSFSTLFVNSCRSRYIHLNSTSFSARYTAGCDSERILSSSVVTGEKKTTKDGDLKIRLNHLCSLILVIVILRNLCLPLWMKGLISAQKNCIDESSK